MAAASNKRELQEPMQERFWWVLEDIFKSDVVPQEIGKLQNGSVAESNLRDVVTVQLRKRKVLSSLEEEKDRIVGVTENNDGIRISVIDKQEIAFLARQHPTNPGFEEYLSMRSDIAAGDPIKAGKSKLEVLKELLSDDPLLIESISNGGYEDFVLTDDDLAEYDPPADREVLLIEIKQAYLKDGKWCHRYPDNQEKAFDTEKMFLDDLFSRIDVQMQGQESKLRGNHKTDVKLHVHRIMLVSVLATQKANILQSVHLRTKGMSFDRSFV